MKPVIQQEKTGCGIASVAAIAGVSYRSAKQAANRLGIYASDPLLWSKTYHVRQLLRYFEIKTGHHEISFTNWHDLPDCALLATKWHIEKGCPFWHWAVYVRQQNESFVLDSNPNLNSHKRTDFGRIKPRWFIKVYR